MPTTQVYALDRNRTWYLSVRRPTLYPLNQTSFSLKAFLLALYSLRCREVERPFLPWWLFKKTNKSDVICLQWSSREGCRGRTLWHVPDTHECKSWLSKFTTWVTRTISLPSLGLQDLILGLIVTVPLGCVMM
uniref:Uncharacterized protein n=1 Tax=Myotis myotis TaxID=51298 RepID=A0A7J7ZYT2_MYOMY|nr:hypothetical protein mMyoMyo1_009769 [Myotis myotis]